MNPIIFLDIDGVLNNDIFFKDRYLMIKSGEWEKICPPMEDKEYWEKYCEERGVPYDIFATKKKTYVREGFYYPYHHEVQEFDPKCIKVLNDFIEKVGADIVISSSWRFSGLEWLKTLFKLVGIKGNVIDITPRIYKEPDEDFDERGCEIQEWISRNKCEAPYVIFDDDSDMTEFQKEHTFVRTNNTYGLTQKDTERAEELLKKQTNNN